MPLHFSNIPYLSLPEALFVTAAPGADIELGEQTVQETHWSPRLLIGIHLAFRFAFSGCIN